MLKILGALCVMMAGIGGGTAMAARLRQRQLFLRGVQQGLLALMRGIDFALPMSRALAEAAEAAGEAKNLFQRAAALLKESDGLTAGEACLQALSGVEAKAEDKELLRLVAEGLGMSGSGGQLKALELSRLRLAEAETKAAAETERGGKIWRTAGWSCGAVLALLLL